MEFFQSSIETLKNIVFLIGAGVGGWGLVNLMEGYSSDNAASKSQGIKQLMSGVGIAMVALQLIPKLSSMFTG